jgi:hypothetical protein
LLGGLRQQPEISLGLIDRILEMRHEGDATSTTKPLSTLHPIRQATQALLDHWFREDPQDNQELPTQLKERFTKLCDSKIEVYRHARVELAANVVSLFRVDADWTRQHVLPLFSWETSPHTEAITAWSGFLWSPRGYPPLMAEFKKDFLQTASHYSKLGDYQEQFATFLTYVALDLRESFSVGELQQTIHALPQAGLDYVAQALVRCIKTEPDQDNIERRAAYWTNRIHPFWMKIWPKCCEFRSQKISSQLAQLALAAQSKFPEVLEAVFDWLKQDSNTYLVHLLKESTHCTNFPAASLKLLNAVVNGGVWVSHELAECLTNISSANASLKEDANYKKLMVLARQSQT